MLNSILNIKPFSFLKSKEIRMLIVVGVLYRITVFLTYYNVTIFPDTFGYQNLANYFVANGLKGYDGTRTLGYPLFILLAFGKNSILIIYQFILGIITWLFWYNSLLNLNFRKKQSFYITLFLGSFIHTFFFETAILIESVTLFFMSWIFYLISDGFLNDDSKRQNYLMAFLLSYLVILKPFFAFIPFVLYGAFILSDFNIRKFINHKIIILFSTVFTYLGISYINKINTGYFVSTTYFGLNLSQNCVYFAENTSNKYKEIGKLYAKHREKTIQENKDPAMTIWNGIDEIQNHTGIEYFPEFSDYLGKYAKETIVLNKKEYIKQVITISWFDFWKTDIYWKYKNFAVPFINKIYLLIWYVQKTILFCLKLSFVLLIPYYIVRYLKNGKITFEIVVVTTVFAASVLQAIVTYGTNARYSFPFEFLIIIIVLMFLREKGIKFLKS